MWYAVAFRRESDGKVFYFGPFAYSWTADEATEQIRDSGIAGQVKAIPLMPWYDDEVFTRQMGEA